MKNRTKFLRLSVMLMGLFLFFASSCDKEDDENELQENVPVLSTTDITEITDATAISGGNITDDGGTAVTARGVCWSTSEAPTINDSKTEDGSGAGSFTSDISGLEPNITYYVRAYATNSVGTGYGGAISFTTLETIELPTLTTTDVTEISAITALSGGNITDDGGATVTARGVCWSTGQNPTINDSKTEDGSGAGSFTSSMTDLEPNTTYYARAFATNVSGTSYGQQVTFATLCPTFAIGEVEAIEIGDQIWMAKNLNINTADSWCFDDNAENCDTYGRLYTWDAAMNVCPGGWRLATIEDWDELFDYVGNSTGPLKAKEWGNNHWNSSCFTALPGGLRHSNGSYTHLDESSGSWWTASEGNIGGPIHVQIRKNTPNLHTSASFNKDFGFSVRCIKN